MNCSVCPRKCGLPRGSGYCGVPALPVIARAALHGFEEPVISGTRGSGTIFFAGCNMRCVYCQNFAVSRAQTGTEITVKRLTEIMLRLEDEGAHNINLVTPSHYTEAITEALAAARLKIPAVYNTSGYDDVGALKKISPYISIWLTDFKYVNPDTAARYSGCADYPAVAAEAIRYMLSRGAPVIGADGLMRSGVIIRHLVLPALRKESIAAVEYLHNNFGNAYLLSLMAQYTVVPECACRELRRRLTTYEYNSVADVARRLGTKGFIQDITAAGAEYIPDFGGKTGC